MSDDSDFDDFFDSPGRQPRLQSRLDKYDKEELETDRSAISSARSNASVKIEARVPSIASDLYSDSDSENDSPRNSKLPNRSSNRPPSGTPQRPNSRRQVQRESSHRGKGYDDNNSRRSPDRERNNSTDRKNSRYSHEKPPAKAGGRKSGRSAWSDDSHSISSAGERKPAHNSRDYERHRATTTTSVSCSGNNNTRSVRGDSHIGINGKRIKHGRCRYSDTEESSEDEQATEVPVVRKSRTRNSYSGSSSENEARLTCKSRSRSRSRSQSSEWSTGSDEEKGKPESTRSARYEQRRREEREHSDSDTISVSSLSDSELPSARTPRKKLEKTDEDRLNLQLLLSALLEADNDRSKDGKKRNMIIVPPEKKVQSRQKSNYTFTDEKARMIDLENQRLLNNIVARRADTKKSHQALRTNPQTAAKKTPGKTRKFEEPKRVTNATINRMREQQRVERENLAMLRRLNQIKPSREVSRTHHIEEYNRQVAYHCPDMRMANSFRSQSSMDGKRAQSAQGFSMSGGRRSRPQSADTYGRQVSERTSYSARPSSAHSTGSAAGKRPRSATIRKRPEWENGW